MANGSIRQFRRRASIRTQGVSDVSFGTRKLSSAIQQGTNQIMAMGKRNLVDDAIKEGKKQAKDFGWKPTEEFTDISRAYNKAGEQANKEFLRTNISQQYNRFLHAAMNNPDASEGQEQFNQASKMFNQKILSQTPKETRDAAENFLKYYHTQGNLKLIDKVQKQRNRETQADLLLSSTNALNDMQDALKNKNVNAGKSFLVKSDETNKNLMLQGTLSPKEYSKSLLKNQTKFVKSLLLTQYRSLLQSQDTKGANELKQRVEKEDVPTLVQQLEGKDKQFNKKSYIASITPGFNNVDKKDLLNAMEQARKEHMQALGVNKSTVHQNMKNNLIRVQNGGDSSVKVEQQAFDIGEGKAYMQKLAEGKEVNSEVSKITAMHLPKQLEQVELLRPTDPNAKDYPQKLSVYNKVKKKVMNFRDEIQGKDADPFRLSLHNSQVQKVAEEEQDANDVNARVPDDLNNSVKQDLPSLTDVSVAYQKAMGWPNPKVDMMAKLKTDVRHFNNADPLSAAKLLEQAKVKYRDNFPLYLKNLKELGAPDNIKYMAVPKDTPYMAEAAAAIQNDLSAYKDISNFSTVKKDINTLFAPDSPTIPSDLESGIFSSGSQGAQRLKSYIDSIKSYNNASTVSHLDSLRNMATKMTLQLMATGKGMSESEAVDKTAQYLLQNTKFISMGSSTLRAPEDMNAGVIRAALKSKEASLPHADFVESGAAPAWITDPQERKEWDFQHVVKGGQWATLPENTGYFLTNSRGYPIKLQNGDQFEVKLKDIENGLNNSNISDQRISSINKDNMTTPRQLFESDDPHVSGLDVPEKKKESKLDMSQRLFADLVAKRFNEGSPVIQEIKAINKESSIL